MLVLLPLLTAKNVLRPVCVKDTLCYEIAGGCCGPIIRNWWERREAAMVARSRARFRVVSMSVAAGAILVGYVVWLFLGK